MTCLPFSTAGRRALVHPAGFGLLLLLPIAAPSAAGMASGQDLARRERADIIMVHRGAAAFAPENTLAAYGAALDYGADGCEIDIRAGSDGELVLFHDDMLDRLTGALGRVEELNLAALLALPPREDAAVSVPTLNEALRFARRRGMLLHLDIKQPGIADRIEEELNRAEVWPLVVQINPANAGSLVDDLRYRPLSYRGPGLYDRRLDVDPGAIRAQLQRPGRMIMVDDPRTAALVLGRQARPASAMPQADAMRPGRNGPEGLPGSLAADDLKLRSEIDRIPLDRREGRLLTLIRTNDPGPPGAAGAGEAERARRIAVRARAAWEMGRLPRVSGDGLRELRGLVARRSLHREWMYMGLDGAMAARALGMLCDRMSVPLLLSEWESTAAGLRRMQDPRYGAYPLAWTDFRFRSEIIPALAAIGGDDAANFLRRYIDLPPEQARELAPLQYEAATLALLAQPLSLEELQSLLRHENRAVRGTAILECRDRPTARRLAALRQAQPWALRLPSAADHPARGQETRTPAAQR